MAGAAKHPLAGKWRITEMELWDADFLDLIPPAAVIRPRARPAPRPGESQRKGGIPPPLPRRRHDEPRCGGVRPGPFPLAPPPATGASDRYAS